MKKILCITLFLLVNALFFHAQTSNINFELTAPGNYTNSNAVAGWTVESATNSSTVGSCTTFTNAVWSPVNPEFWIRQTPMFNHPYLGYIPNSPLGGTHVAQLNNTLPGNLITKLKTTFTVTNANSLFAYAYCGSLDGNGHACCSQPFLKINLYNCSGVLQNCSSQNFVPSGASCVNGQGGYMMTNGINWTNWRIGYLDLMPYLGNCVTIEIINGDCTDGNHHGSSYFDAVCGTYPEDINLTATGPVSQISYCPTSSLATISAPMGYSAYSWTASPGAPPINPSQNTLSVLSITNPIPGSTYTVTMSNSPYYLSTTCTISQVYTLNPTLVSIAANGVSSSCAGGSSGSATVLAKGSANGYNYAWMSSTNSLVSTSSVAINLSPGVYGLTVTALGAPGCGGASANFSIGISPPGVIATSRSFCDSTAFLSLPIGGSYQWYNGLSAISASLGGTVSGYTVSPAFNNAVYYGAYSSNQGCRDSIKFSLVNVPLVNVSVTFNKLACTGSFNGEVAISVTPSSPGMHYFFVNSLGMPPYSSSVNPTSSNTWSFFSLYAGGTFSVNAYDGACVSSTVFSMPVFTYNFNISPAQPSLCAGNSAQASTIIASSSNSTQYTYSWSPANMLQPGTSSSSVAILLPAAAPGTQTIINYSITLMPLIANCPITKTYSVLISNPANPIVAAVPSLCANSPPITLTVVPTGGIFSCTFSGSNNPLAPTTGILTPSLAPIGIYTFTYSNILGNCSASSPGIFTIVGPNISASGNRNFCFGNSTTLTATGANSYTWSNGNQSSSITLTPVSSTVMGVTGTSTLSGCAKTITLGITVVPFPTLSVNGNFTICFGNSTTLSAGGAQSYSWNTGPNTSSILVTPIQTNTYFVTGANSGTCTNSASVQVLVQPTPFVSINYKSPVCRGDAQTLKAGGAHKYLWNTLSTADSIFITPAPFSYFYVTGTDTVTKCSTYKLVSIEVNECLNVNENIEYFSQIQISPNPSSGKFRIEKEGDLHIIIYDQLGKMVLENDFDNGIHEIDVPYFSNGIYFVLMLSEGGNTLSKLIIMH